MVPPYQEQIEKATGRIMVNPNSAPTGTFSEIMPAGGITPSGKWVPLNATEQGTLFVETDTSIATMPHFDSEATETTPGAQQTLISELVPANTTRSLSQAFVITRVTGTFWVLANSEIVGSGRTGPSGTGPMIWNPPMPLDAGTSYEIIFQSRNNSPVQDVEAYIQASDMAG